MGNPDMDGRLPALQADGIIAKFYTTDAWIDGRAEDQLREVAAWRGVARIAAFPDLHPGKYGPVGCAVLADRIYPQLIGNDIGCGMSLFQLDLAQRRFRLDKALRRIRVLGTPTEVPQGARLEGAGLSATLFPTALGSIGGGNHFCEVQALKEAGEGCGLDRTRLFLLVHSGSRALGEATFAALPQGAFQGLSPDSPEGAAYLAGHADALRWASLNRRIIAERAGAALRADIRLVADVAHNLLERTPQGWLHRKGAAVGGALVPVAGSRASASYLVRHLGNRASLASLAHGAGRRHDRASMHGRLRAGRSDIEAMQRNAFGGRVICEDRDLLIEEAPQAYKSAQSVVADLEATGVAQRLATLHPLLTFKKTRREGKR